MAGEARMDVVAETGSTNADLLRAAGADPGAWPHLSALLTRRQIAGRGRSGRTWTSHEHAALTFSILLRPEQPRAQWGWLPLLGGVAVVHALRAAMADGGTRAEPAAHPGLSVADGGGHQRSPATLAEASGSAREETVGLKWPNDVVHLGGTAVLAEWGCLRKVGGLLAEVLPDGHGVVLGIGINLDGQDLPVPWAGTAAELGVRAEPTQLARSIRTELADCLDQWADGQHPRELVAPVCLSLGTAVRVALPDGSAAEGEAVDLADDGGLRIRTATGEQVVRAGDVAHLRAR